MSCENALRILLVDDDKDLLDLLEYNFEKEGFLVRTVARIEMAIAVARKFEPHLIILDVLMPGGNGLDLFSPYLSTLKNGVEQALGRCNRAEKISRNFVLHVTRRDSFPGMREGAQA